MPSSIYLINPLPDFPTYFGADVLHRLALRPTAFVADLATVTVAAFAPPDFRVDICDECISPADLGHPAELVGITGRANQAGRMRALARAFRRRGRTVIIGGPHASLAPEELRDDCDILVRGEIETIASDLFTDLRSGTWKREYQGSPADLSEAPLPRWDLYPHQRALQGCLQTSRGCPFNCEFCDTIQYVGRRQRHKPPALVIRELESLYRLGYRAVFLADDNLTAHRPRARELMQVFRDWNQAAPAGRVRFSSQLSLDAAAHPELLQLCAAAGLSEAFVGIETPNPESLQECGKRQNLGFDLTERTTAFVSNGIGVIGGLVLGFDADPPEIFRRQYDFAMTTPVPSYGINALIAPPSTPLHQRMQREGRLLTDADAPGPITPWWTNLQPRQMTRHQLQKGIRWLVNRLYRPVAFEARMAHFINAFEPPLEPRRASGVPRREVNLEAVSMVRRLAGLGDRERSMLQRLVSLAKTKPATQPHLFANLFRYMQVRALYEEGGLWDPRLAERPAPHWRGT